MFRILEQQRFPFMKAGIPNRSVLARGNKLGMLGRAVPLRPHSSHVYLFQLTDG